MMWKEIYEDLKRRLIKYNSKLLEQPKRSVLRMCSAIFWFFFFIMSFHVLKNKTSGYAVFLVIIAILALIRFMYIYLVYCDKKNNRYIIYILMAIIELCVFIFSFYFVPFYFMIIIMIMMLVASPFIYSIIDKKTMK